MAQTEYTNLEIPRIPGAKIAILQSKWHQNYTDVMLKKCLEVLSNSECEKPELHLLPGCFELPLAAQSLIKKDPSFEAFIVFGALIKGQTFHFEMVLEQCTRGLGQVMHEYEIPIINEILPVTEESQLISRCSNDNKNKGIEAAIATSEVIHWRRQLSKKSI